MVDDIRKQVVVAMLLCILPFGLIYFVIEPGYNWFFRIITVVILILAGILLDFKTALFPGIFMVTADYLYLLHSARELRAIDPLIWAFFICLPYFISLYRDKHSEEFARMKDEFTGKNERSMKNGAEQLVSFPGQSDVSADPRQRVQELITDFFESFTDQLGFSNLLYFHVRSSKATLGYLINNLGQIKDDSVFTPDIGQGVGWVLRHDEALSIPGSQLDWRNLQYHLQPVDIGYIKLQPVKQSGQLIGILVMEWENREKPAEDLLEEFSQYVEQLMILDHSVRRLVKNQKQLKVMEKFYEINPLRQENYSSIIQRVLEIINEFIPAQNIDFYPPDGEKLQQVTPPARRKAYEQSVGWVLKTKKILRINDLKTEKLAGRSLDRFGQTELKSLLAGPVYDGDELTGVLVLDHEESGYFTSDEERILKLLLKQLGQTLKIATCIRNIKGELDEQLQLFVLLEELVVGKHVGEAGETLVKRLVEKISLQGAAFYWWNNDRYELVYFKGPGQPSQAVGNDDSLVRRLKNSGRETSLLSFPETDHLDEYEAPVGVMSLLASGVFREDKLRGFILLFQEDKSQPSQRIKEVLSHVLQVGRERLALLDICGKWKYKAGQDTVCALPAFKNWRKDLSEKIREGTPKIISWQIEVPGFEKIGAVVSKKKLDGWVKSIARLLKRQLPEASICRAYGSVFYGFSLNSDADIEKQLFEICEELKGWEYPAGNWPAEPRYLIASFSAPYPNVEKIIQAPAYGRRGKEEK